MGGRADLAPICKKKPIFYELLPRGSPECPSGAEITTQADCSAALTALGLPTYLWTVDASDIPPQCSVSFPGVAGYFNANAGGRARPDLAKVCKKILASYERLANGARGCAAGTEITTQAECAPVLAAMQLPAVQSTASDGRMP